MRYIPNLIPKQYHVDIEPPVSAPLNSTPSVLLRVGSYVGVGIFFTGFVGTIFTRFWQGVIALMIALLFLPRVHEWIEQTLRFKFTWIIKSCMVVILIVVLNGFSSRYDRLHHEEVAKERADSIRVAEEKEKLRIEEKKQQKQLSDTLEYFRSEATLKIKQRKYTSAVTLLSQALTFSARDPDLLFMRAETNYRSGSYQDAMDDYSRLIDGNYKTFDSFFQRANCFLKLGNKANAVSDLKQAIRAGNERALQLYNKINPLKRRIIGYITRCCDGTSSNAKGRGACSHHHGVCNWDEPIYQEYRQFE